MATGAASKSPSPLPAQASARLLLPLAFYLVALGHARDTLRATLGVDATAIALGDARLPRQTVFDAYRRVEALTGEPGLGLRLAALLDLRSLGRGAPVAEYPMIQLFVTSSTVGEGLGLMSRYFEIFCESASLVIEPAGARVGVRLVLRGEPAPPAFVEFMIGWIANGVRRLAVPSVDLAAVHFAHARPASEDEHERFFGVAPRFSAGEDAFFLEREALAARFEEGTPALLAALVRRADEQLARITPRASLADRVADQIAAALPLRRPTVAQVARALGMSVRTLARRLDEDGASYTKVLERVRAELARRYLIEERLPVSEVARRLHFADLRTFRRAFRQWYGQSPTEYLRRAG